MSDVEQANNTGPSWDTIQQNISSEVILEYLREQKHERRWKTIRRVFISVMILGGIVLYAGTLAGSLGYRLMPSAPTVAVVPVSGVIARHTEASADSVITVLTRLFESKHVEGIVLLVDSGGGSPSEAERITRFVNAAQAETGKRVIAVCGSACASAAYMIAINADRVYAGEYSLAGSIGAIMKGWDLTHLMERFEVGQRVFASAPLKDLMNPYAPMSEEMTGALQGLVDETARIFEHEVRERRGTHLDPERQVATGELWTGRDAMELGLVDELGTLDEVVAKEFPGLPVAVYRPKRKGNTLFDRLLGDIGRGFAEALMDRQREVVL